MHALIKFIRDEEGLTVIEYVIGASLLVGAVTLIFAGVGDILGAKLTAIIGRIV